MIITYEYEGEIERDGLRIEIIPSWKWVLNEGHSDTNNFCIYYLLIINILRSKR